MPTPAIIARVKELQAELGETTPSPKTAPGIDEIKKQVAAVILAPSEVPHYKSLGDKLLFHYIGFQIDHPKLAAAMERVTNELAAAGL